MSTKRNSKKPKTITVGWICGVCKKRDYNYHKQKECAALRMLRHITNKHPKEHESGDWYVVSIKGEI